MSETQELEHITDLLRANEEIERLRSLLAEAIEQLEDVDRVLDCYADAEIFEEGQIIGNTAMNCMVEVQETLAKIKRALPPPPAQEGE